MASFLVIDSIFLKLVLLIECGSSGIASAAIFGRLPVKKIRGPDHYRAEAAHFLELAAAADQEAQETIRRQKTEEFRERFANPFVAAERGYIDDVIEPRETRPRVIRALRMLENKVDTMPRKKHGNIPL